MGLGSRVGGLAFGSQGAWKHTINLVIPKLH